MVKVVAGIVYGIIHRQSFWGGDTALYFDQANIIYHSFGKYPGYYIQSFLGFRPAPPGDESQVFWYPPTKEYFKDFGVYLIVHINVFFRIFSFGHYDVHVVFMAFLSTIGGINFYKVFRRMVHIPRFPLIMLSFFIPSVLFWTSGLHKDAFIYLGMSFFVLGLFYYDHWRKRRKRAMSYIVLGGLLVALFRPYLAFLLAPALLVWVMFRYNQRPWLNLALVYFSCFLLLVCYDLARKDFNALEMMAIQQREFRSEKGSSSFETESLDKRPVSFISYLPTAMANTLFRPYIWECKAVRHLLAFIEVASIWVILLVMVFFFKPRRWGGVDWMMACYVTTNFLLIGYLTANSGTLVRYKAVSLGLLLFLIISHIDYDKLWVVVKPRFEKAKRVCGFH